MVRLHADRAGIAGVELVPVQMDPETPGLSLVDDLDGFLVTFQRLSDIITDEELHERSWKA